MSVDVYISPQTQRLLAYAAEQYGERAEFLWEKLPTTAILRADSSHKWYAVFARVERRKITGSGSELVEIADWRYQRELLPDLLKYHQGIYPGWHMNKDNWITTILDESWRDEQLQELLDNSRAIAAGKGRKDYQS